MAGTFNYKQALEAWGGNVYYTYEGLQLAVARETLDELQAIRRLLECNNTLAIPGLLRKIAKNTTKATKRKNTTKATKRKKR